MYPQQQFDYRNLLGGGFGGFNPYGQFGGFNPMMSPSLFGGFNPYNDLFAGFQTKLDDLFKNYQTQLNANAAQQSQPVASENSAAPKPATGAQKNKQSIRTKTADGTIMNNLPIPNTLYGTLRFPKGVGKQAGGMKNLPMPKGMTPITPSMTPAQIQSQINRKLQLPGTMNPVDNYAAR